MSNDDVYFGEPDDNGNQAKGSFDRLPESVQKAISISNLDYPAGEVERRQITDIAGSTRLSVVVDLVVVSGCDVAR